MTMKFGFGQPLTRKEDDVLLRGAGRYVADVAPEAALHAVVVRSPHAHARFRIGNIEQVRAMPSVRLVLAAADLAHLGPLPTPGLVPDVDIKIPPHPVLARDEVRYVGDSVAFIVADTLPAAKDAAEALAIDWQPLPHVTGALAALKKDAPQVWLDRPGNLDSPAAVHTADYLAESLGFVLVKRAGAGPGTTAVLKIEGHTPYGVVVNADGRGEPLAEIPEDPTVRLAMGREAFILLAVNWNGLKSLHKKTPEGVTEQGTFSQEGHRPLQSQPQDHRIEQAIRMVEDKQDRAIKREMLLAPDLQPGIKEAHQGQDEPTDQALERARCLSRIGWDHADCSFKSGLIMLILYLSSARATYQKLGASLETETKDRLLGYTLQNS